VERESKEPGQSMREIELGVQDIKGGQKEGNKELKTRSGGRPLRS
jgi:hypothetical protein